MIECLNEWNLIKAEWELYWIKVGQINLLKKCRTNKLITAMWHWLFSAIKTEVVCFNCSLFLYKKEGALCSKWSSTALRAVTESTFCKQKYCLVTASKTFVYSAVILLNSVSNYLFVMFQKCLRSHRWYKEDGASRASRYCQRKYERTVLQKT